MVACSTGVDILRWAKACPDVVELALRKPKTQWGVVPSKERLDSASFSDVRGRFRVPASVGGKSRKKFECDLRDCRLRWSCKSRFWFCPMLVLLPWSREMHMRRTSSVSIQQKRTLAEISSSAAWREPCKPPRVFWMGDGLLYTRQYQLGGIFDRIWTV